MEGSVLPVRVSMGVNQDLVAKLHHLRKNLSRGADLRSDCAWLVYSHVQKVANKSGQHFDLNLV